MKVNFKRKNGITLVALVVTIVILLILVGVGIQAITSTGIFEKAGLSREKDNNSKLEEQNTLNQYEEQITLGLHGSRNILEIKSCNLKITHDIIKNDQGSEEVNTIINVDGVENIKKLIISVDGKYCGSTDGEGYRLPATVRGKKNIYAIAIDSDMNIYKSNELNYDVEYPFKDEDLMLYWYGVEKNKDIEFGLWTQYSSWWKVNRNTNNIVFTGGHTASGGVVAGFTTKEMVDLSLYKAMHIIFESTASAGKFSIVSSLGNQGSYGNEGGVIGNFEVVNEPTEYTVDLTSITGSYYIGTQIWGAEGDYKVLGWWLEK